jgi:hypothetical protein
MSATIDAIGSYAGWLITRAGGLLAVFGVGKLFLGWWRGGPGRRRRWTRLFTRQLTLGVRAEYVVGLFGEPAYQRTYEGRRLDISTDEQPADEPAIFTERIWRLADDGYLQLLTDDQNNVVRYSLTTCSGRFRPVIALGSFSADYNEFEVKLGVTRFSDIPWPPARLSIGPSGATAPYEYLHAYDFGRSGGYADWICVYNASGHGAYAPIELGLNPPTWNQRAMTVAAWYEQLPTQGQEQVNAGRRETVINTVTVESFLSDHSDQSHYGPDREQVHLMPRTRRWYQYRTIRRLRRSNQ